VCGRMHTEKLVKLRFYLKTLFKIKIMCYNSIVEKEFKIK